jgi:hypothetical protein
MKFNATILAAASTAALNLWLTSAKATDRIVICVENHTGVAASDLHVNFTGAGGNLYVDPTSVVAIGCPTPTVPSNGTVTNTAVIDWGSGCVGSGSAVLFIASTTNGPLGVSGGHWTSAGADIGPITICAGFPKPLPPGGGGPLGALKIQVWCAPATPAFYAGCQKVPGAICWRWFCCIPAGTYWWRAIWCPNFASRQARLFEAPPWFILTGWMPDGAFAGSYRWVQWTLPQPPPLPPVGPPLPAGTNGPPPFRSPRFGHPFPPHRYSFQVRYSDDGGGTFRQGGDFIQSFFDVFTALDIIQPTTTVFATNFTAILANLAPRYSNAAAALGPLISELRNVETNPPDSTIMQMRIDTEILQLSLSSMSTQFFGGHVLDPTPYQGASNSLADLALRLNQVSAQINLPRLRDSASSLQLMANTFGYATAVVATGQMETNASEQDNFFWALQNRVWTEWHLAASAMLTHLRVYLPLNNWSWSKSTIDQARVKLQDRNTGEVLEDFFVPLSDASYFDVPYLLPENLAVRLWFKLPTHLSVAMDLNLQDGLQVTVPSLVAGDANGDNCIDSADLQQVQQDMGTGGPNAVSVSSSDVNGDGYVNTTDLQIVSANFGLCGQQIAPPLLKSLVDASGNLELRFPFDFQLQSSPTLPATNWPPYLVEPQVLGSFYHVFIGAPLTDSQFFRASGR